MVEFFVNIERLRIMPGDTVSADRINQILDAIIEIRKAIIKHDEEHKSNRTPP